MARREGIGRGLRTEDVSWWRPSPSREHRARREVARRVAPCGRGAAITETDRAPRLALPGGYAAASAQSYGGMPGSGATTLAPGTG